MRYRLLGETGLRVSELCLGAMTFGEAWGPMASGPEAAKAMMTAYAEAGGNFIDTANNYQNGQSELLVGDFIHADRDRWVLASKYTLCMQPGDPNAWGNHRKNLARSVEASLKRLRTDYLDLLWVHIWDFSTSPEEVMRGLEDLTRAGKILHVGASDTPAWMVSQASTLARLRGWNPFSAIQVEYSLLQRDVERELAPMARSLKLGLLAWSPLAGGLLSGKFQGGAPDSGRTDWVAKRLAEPRTQRVVAEVCAVATETGRTPSQVALRWLRQQEGLVLPILGARKPEQLRDNLACLDFQLDEAQLKRLDEVSAEGGSFIKGMWENPYLVDTFITGGTLAAIEPWRREV